MLLSPGRASCKTLANSKQPSESHSLRNQPSRGLAATPQPRPTKAALEEFCQTRQESSPSNLRQSTRTFTHIYAHFTQQP